MSPETSPNPHERLIARVTGEYLEMPGLRLTPDQARRLWGLDTDTCALVLRALVETGFLACGQDGRYARRSEERTSTPAFRMAKVDVDGRWSVLSVEVHGVPDSRAS